MLYRDTIVKLDEGEKYDSNALYGMRVYLYCRHLFINEVIRVANFGMKAYRLKA